MNAEALVGDGRPSRLLTLFQSSADARPLFERVEAVNATLLTPGEQLSAAGHSLHDGPALHPLAEPKARPKA